MVCVGYKIPSTEVLKRIDPPRTPPAFDRRWYLSGLHPQLQLQEDSAWTPTGAGSHPRLRLQEDFFRTPMGARLRAPTATDSLRVFAVNDLLQISTTSGPYRISTVSLHPSFHYGRISFEFLLQTGLGRDSSTNDPHPGFYKDRTPIELL